VSERLTPAEVRRALAKAKRTALEDKLAGQLDARGLCGYQREYVFAPPRKFRFDFCWPDLALGVEVEGGTWSCGRHVRGAGYAQDLEKYNLAAAQGWLVLRFTGEMVKSGSAVQDIARALQLYEGERE
jgi:very-short-patch-repair endonuclease